MPIKKANLNDADYPLRLSFLADPPAQLFSLGTPLEDLLARPCVAVVGSRRVTPYGRQITLQIAGELAAQGITIISGLALGVDGLAHQAALEAGGLTIAVMPCDLGRIYPATNTRLGRRILEQGGALVSEYDASAEFTYKTNFIARNRIISGLADAVLITEAAVDSGSLHTADFALQQGKELMVVPGNVTSPMSRGANNLLLSHQAHFVTCTRDILGILNIAPQNQQTTIIGRNPAEQAVIELLASGISDGEQLISQSGLTISHFNQTLTMLEITGKVRALGNNQWALR
jgi:DNA processing protein